LKKNTKKYDGIKCPFLDNNKCSIYTVRPFSCRRFIVLEDDNSKCKCISKIHTMIDDYIFRYIFKLIITYFRKINEQDISDNAICSSFSDIRENFEKN